MTDSNVGVGYATTVLSQEALLRWQRGDVKRQDIVSFQPRYYSGFDILIISGIGVKEDEELVLRGMGTVVSSYSRESSFNDSTTGPCCDFACPVITGVVCDDYLKGDVAVVPDREDRVLNV